ncbi:MAG: hypothetical protein ABFC94_03615 [Syntrophomonas sp.]
MLRKKPSFLSIITVCLITILLLCIFKAGQLWLFIALLALKLAIVLLILYLLFKWRRITAKDRLSILFSIIAWVGLLYGLKW